MAHPLHWIGIAKGWQQAGSPLSSLVSLPPIAMRAHVLVLGATGSGKTNLIHHLIAQDILLGHSFVVLDLRGDLVMAGLSLCAGNVPPHLVKLLDLREKTRPLGFNPLYGAGEPYFRALAILEAISIESESWGVQLAETLRNALMLLAEAGVPLTELERLFHDAAFLRHCLQRCTSEPVLAFWQRFGEMSRERQAALAMPVTNKVSLLFSTKTLRTILSHPAPLDLGRHINTRGSLTLVSLAADELHGAGRMMGRLFLSSLTREVFARVGIPESRRNQVRLYVDEFEHFGTSEFETILAEGRRFGLSLVLAHQTLAQLSPRLRSIILGNVGTKIVFRCGYDDGVALSRDLTGDPKALDLASLPVGEAVLWQRASGAIAIEVNEPLLRDVGALSPSGRLLWQAVVANNPPAPKVKPPRVTSAPAPTSPSSTSRTPTITPELEDWL